MLFPSFRPPFTQSPARLSVLPVFLSPVSPLAWLFSHAFGRFRSRSRFHMLEECTVIIVINNAPNPAFFYSVWRFFTKTVPLFSPIFVRTPYFTQVSAARATRSLGSRPRSPAVQVRRHHNDLTVGQATRRTLRKAPFCPRTEPVKGLRGPHYSLSQFALLHSVAGSTGTSLSQ